MTIEGVDVGMDDWAEPEDDWEDTAQWERFVRGEVLPPPALPQRVRREAAPRVSAFGRLVLRLRRAVRRG